MSASAAVFSLHEVFYSYLHKYPAVSKVTLDIFSGQTVALLGANGSGKSTLLQILDGLIFPQEGKVDFLGKQLREDDFSDPVFSRDFRSKVGLLFQNSDIQLFCPTVREDIAFGPLYLGFAPDEIEERIAQMSARLRIEKLLDRAPYQLSVGEKRKVAIAGVLAISPDVLLLDEPTAGLDPATVRQLLDLIFEYHAQGKTVITATHDLHIIREIADIVFIMGEDKTIVARGTSDEILANEELLLRYNLAHIHKHRHGTQWHEHPHKHQDNSHH